MCLHLLSMNKNEAKLFQICVPPSSFLWSLFRDVSRLLLYETVYGSVLGPRDTLHVLILWFVIGWEAEGLGFSRHCPDEQTSPFTCAYLISKIAPMCCHIKVDGDSEHVEVQQTSASASAWHTDHTQSSHLPDLSSSCLSLTRSAICSVSSIHPSQSLSVWPYWINACKRGLRLFSPSFLNYQSYNVTLFSLGAASDVGLFGVWSRVPAPKFNLQPEESQNAFTVCALSAQQCSHGFWEGDERERGRERGREASCWQWDSAA